MEMGYRVNLYASDDSSPFGKVEQGGGFLT
jgi:hypothetical protein